MLKSGQRVMLGSMDAKEFGRVVESSSGGSFGFDKFYQLVVEGKFSSGEYGYAMGNAFKDMEVVAELEKVIDVELKVIGATRKVYKEALDKGYGKLNKGAMVKVYEERMGVKVTK